VVRAADDQGGETTQDFTLSVEGGEECESPEICGDGEDNDCDDEVDEGFEDHEEPCTIFVGACEREGIQLCSADGLTLICSAVAGEDESKICDDEVDNDCDEAVDLDDDHDCPEEPLPCVVGEERACGLAEGACEPGVATCVEVGDGTIWTVCDGAVEPVDEECDNDLDDDCQGAIDDGCACEVGEDRPCGSDEGTCESGRRHCGTDRLWGSCLDTISPTLERDDGFDNDCDGEVDEGFVPPDKGDTDDLDDKIPADAGCSCRVAPRRAGPGFSLVLGRLVLFWRQALNR
jgi:hypothetical protein